MKFIEPSYNILSEDFTRNKVIETIARAARTCYQSEPKTEDSNVKLVKSLVKRGHEAMLEHGPLLSVSFTTCRGVSHEIVRNRLFSFAQESTRYVKYGKEDENGNKEHMLFILPPWIRGREREILLSHELPFDDKDMNLLFDLSASSYYFAYSCTESERNYANLLKEGWKAQQAREVLPNALKTEIVVTGNIRQWRHFFYLRCDKPAHPQMRELMIPLFNELREDIPEVWNDIADKIDLEIQV